MDLCSSCGCQVGIGPAAAVLGHAPNCMGCTLTHCSIHSTSPLQGTNAHAVLEVLDMGALQGMFDHSQNTAADGRPLPLWQRASFWLLPPTSVLLGRCLGKASGSIVLQGDLRSPAVAALVRGAATNGGWAVAAEAACAAAAMLAAGSNGKQQWAVGLAAVMLAPGAGESLATEAALVASVDARSGSVSVAAGSTQVLGASVFAAVERPGSTAQCADGQQQTVQLAAVLTHAATTAAAAAAEVVAPETQHAQNHHGFFLQPALLEAASQLQQLPATDVHSSQPSEPAAFGCLLPGIAGPNTPSSSSSSDGKAGSSSRLWGASATERSLRLCSSSSGGSSLFLSGMQHRQLASRPKAGAAAAAAEISSTSVNYTTTWQAVQPSSPASCPEALCSRRAKRAAVLTTSGSGRGSSRKPGLVACLPLASSPAVDASQTACFRGLQLLQMAASQGDSTITLTAAAPATASGPVLSSRSTAGTTSSALFALLRCAASELPSVRITAGSIAEAAVAADSIASSGMWDASCYGQQQTAGALLAARLLPDAASSEQQAAQQLFSASGQSWAVSGGTGALGLLVAGWLQQLQAAGVVLLGRTGRLPSAASSELLGACDGCLTVRMCDAAAAEDAVAAASPSVVAGTRPLVALVHAGGILQDAALAAQSPATIRAVHAPKTAGLRQLLAAAGAAAPLHQALLFSSIAAVTGPAGSTNYAAANAALDAAAGQMQLQGKRGSFPGDADFITFTILTLSLASPDSELTPLLLCSPSIRRPDRQQRAVGCLGIHWYGGQQHCRAPRHAALRGGHVAATAGLGGHAPPAGRPCGRCRGAAGRHPFCVAAFHAGSPQRSRLLLWRAREAGRTAAAAAAAWCRRQPRHATGSGPSTAGICICGRGGVLCRGGAAAGAGSGDGGAWKQPGATPAVGGGRAGLAG